MVIVRDATVTVDFRGSGVAAWEEIRRQRLREEAAADRVLGALARGDVESARMSFPDVDIPSFYQQLLLLDSAVLTSILHVLRRKHGANSPFALLISDTLRRQRRRRMRRLFKTFGFRKVGY